MQRIVDELVGCRVTYAATDNSEELLLQKKLIIRR